MAETKNLEELVKELNESIASFQAEASAQVEKGNKAAGGRARKLSLAITKALKEFRAASVNYVKE